MHQVPWRGSCLARKQAYPSHSVICHLLKDIIIHLAMMAARGMTTLAVCFQFIPHSSSLFAAVPAVGHVGTERTGGSYGKEERRIGG